MFGRFSVKVLSQDEISYNMDDVQVLNITFECVYQHIFHTRINNKQTLTGLNLLSKSFVYLDNISL